MLRLFFHILRSRTKGVSDSLDNGYRSIVKGIHGQGNASFSITLTAIKLDYTRTVIPLPSRIAASAAGFYKNTDGLQRKCGS